MKREMMGEDDYNQNKRSRNFNGLKYDDALAENKYQLRILIPSRSVGAVIGKGGLFIKEIRLKV